MPHALIDELDLIVTRRVSRGLPGDRRAPGVGAGTELSQLRPYQVGDDVRHIDAAATARTGEPHVRLHVPERTLTTWIVLDVSPSMAFGTDARLKADVAEGVAPDGHGEGGRGSDLADALARVGKVAKGPGVVTIISDFRDQAGWERALGALRVHHAVLAIEITDPREAEVPAVGRLALVDPETGARVEVDTSSPHLRERFAAIERERREGVARELKRLRIEHVALSTDDDWLVALGRRLR